MALADFYPQTITVALPGGAYCVIRSPNVETVRRFWVLFAPEIASASAVLAGRVPADRELTPAELADLTAELAPLFCYPPEVQGRIRAVLETCISVWGGHPLGLRGVLGADYSPAVEALALAALSLCDPVRVCRAMSEAPDASKAAAARLGPSSGAPPDLAAPALMACALARFYSIDPAAVGSWPVGLFMDAADAMAPLLEAERPSENAHAGNAPSAGPAGPGPGRRRVTTRSFNPFAVSADELRAMGHDVASPRRPPTAKE